MTVEQKAEEWRKNYKPMGVTCIERYDVTVETQSKPTRIIENPNPFRIKDGWYDLYLKDLENAYIAGAKGNDVQWHNLKKDPNDLPKHSHEVLCLLWGGTKEIGYYKNKIWYFEDFTTDNEDVDYWQEIIPPKEIE